MVGYFEWVDFLSTKCNPIALRAPLPESTSSPSLHLTSLCNEPEPYFKCWKSQARWDLRDAPANRQAGKGNGCGSLSNLFSAQLNEQTQSRDRWARWNIINAHDIFIFRRRLISTSSMLSAAALDTFSHFRSIPVGPVNLYPAQSGTVGETKKRSKTFRRFTDCFSLKYGFQWMGLCHFLSSNFLFFKRFAISIPMMLLLKGSVQGENHKRLSAGCFSCD